MKILFIRETELQELNPIVLDREGLAATESCLILLAKELAKNAISDAKVKAEVEKMISGSTNYLKNMLNSIIPVSESISKEISFSEKYKASFGL